MSFVRTISVGELMTKQVVSVHPFENLKRVENIFSANGFHHLPVVDEDKVVVGMISLSDFNKVQHSFTIFNTADSKRINDSIFNSILVSEVMTKKIATVKATDTALYAVGIFRENLFHALPVVDEAGKLTGMLTTYDLLTYAYNEPEFLNS